MDDNTVQTHNRRQHQNTGESYTSELDPVQPSAEHFNPKYLTMSMDLLSDWEAPITDKPDY